MKSWLLQCTAFALLHHGAVRAVSEPTAEEPAAAEPAAAEQAESDEHGMEVVHHDKVSAEPEHTDEPLPEGVGEHHEEAENGPETHGEEGGPLVPEKGESEDGHHAGEHASHPAVCILLYASIMIGPAIVLLANSSDPLLSGSTYRLLEAFITIFIAVQYFQAFDELLAVGEFAEHHAFIAAVLHLLFLFFLATIISWGVRRNSSRLAVFTACGAHYVAFSACHTSGKLQLYFFSTLDSQPLYFLALFLGLAAMAALMHFFRSAMSMTKQEKFEESIDDLENDAIALCIGYSIAHTLDYVLSGEIDHFGKQHTPDQEAEAGFLQLQVGHGDHKTYAISLMLLTALISASMSAFLPKAKEEDSWAKAKVLSIAKSAFVMIAAFTFLIGTEWVFHNAYPQENESIKLFRDIVFALACTLIAMFSIFLMSVVKVHHTADFSRTVPLAVGLAAAFAWEEVFDKAVDILSESYHVVPGPDNDEAVVKVILALGSPLFLLPMYVLHIKPHVPE